MFFLCKFLCQDLPALVVALALAGRAYFHPGLGCCGDNLCITVDRGRSAHDPFHAGTAAAAGMGRHRCAGKHQDQEQARPHTPLETLSFASRPIWSSTVMGMESMHIPLKVMAKLSPLFCTTDLFSVMACGSELASL